ncbi:hypothetical protein OG562_12425 [Streptomyces sp. NBC_01275]|uniref:hypothetical protein n=1 Tax=Streptomyces sp. NBC_01275 TaxID=2903807 RepID=UPI00224D899D|nr:hypothetical protein [Streptomyces sp. NBC_01275]MCX4761766.1 hypothetical protein [Streptomyces sp. NBC_01275]
MCHGRLSAATSSAVASARGVVVVARGLTMPDDKRAALRLPVLTERGDQAVRQARARHADPDPAKRTEPYAPGEAAAAYAVFGPEAYHHFALTRLVSPPRSTKAPTNANRTRPPRNCGATGPTSTGESAFPLFYTTSRPPTAQGGVPTSAA